MFLSFCYLAYMLLYCLAYRVFLAFCYLAYRVFMLLYYLAVCVEVGTVAFFLLILDELP